MIEDDIRTLLVMATPLPIIIANGNGPRPPQPYITMRLATSPRAGLLEAGLSDDGIQAFAAQRDGTVELQCFGEGSFDALDDMSQLLKGPALLAAAYEANLAIYATDAVQNVPVLRDGGRFEPRAVLDIGVRYTKQHDEDVGLIKTVRGEMALQGQVGELVDNFEASAAD